MALSLETVASEVASPLAVIVALHAKAQTEEMQRYYRICLKWMVRELPLPATKASERALVRASEIGVGKLSQLSWARQSAYDTGRKILHWEHLRPVSDIVDDLIALDPVSDADVRRVIATYQVVWITKEENDLLPRSKRLNPFDDYRRVGIVLVDLE